MDIPRHDVVVVGAGNGGVSAAARLLKRGSRDVAIVEPAEEHVYKPLQNYVGAGLAKPSALTRPQAKVMPKGAHWYRAAAERIDAERREVVLSDGSTIRGGDIVIACGAPTDWDALPGAREALENGPACSTFESSLLEQTWERISALTAGTAVFTFHEQPASGRETALKPLFLACDHWRRMGVLAAIDVILVHDGEGLHPVAEIESAVRRELRRYGVTLRLRTRVERIEGGDVTLSGPDGTATMRPDLLHLLPPYTGHPLVRASGLDAPDTGGFVAVDRETLQHRAHPHVWAIGDAADLDDARTGGALRHQTQTLVENIQRRRTGRALSHYDGYTVAPITTSRRSLVFGEYDARTHRAVSTIPLLDTFAPRPWWYVLDRYLLPQLYWHGIVKGRL
ncbi:FAD/NAD(P)-binding oxidoreductase [Microbacterium oryzae]|uniref:NAD(P)/FAD-dependent oxidoreductase n=1 Tax=Microbacterium oryzae TaxID=743009 RepID=A0A6I6DWF7_9MICO|nr:FAD/NAD(P)-binding oxidoreductase [Microbacterium oryzae]QGU28496.1 NAD(P)/FAD-dependent oxidoreductase [Microbacterium oryzae]